MSDELKLEALPLHDSVLLRTELLWSEGICRLHLQSFVVPGERATPHVLEFNGVTRLIVSRAEPWGPSEFVNAARGSGKDGFEIEMQSGDLIEIIGSGFEFRAA